MGRIRKTEPDIVVSASAAAPARRKIATTPRTPHPIAAKAVAVAVESVEFRNSPTNEEIATLAYSYWVARGHAEGCQEEDWLRAERELQQRAI